MDNQARAHALVDQLRLERPPVALAFVTAPPADVEQALPAPSACTFWRLAERSVFYAEASDHYECPVGAMTMGFELPAEQQSAAQQLLGTMIELEYIGADEVEHLPSVQKPHGGILYGPLEQFPGQPDSVLVIASPYQAMILAEATDAVKLRKSPDPSAGSGQALPAMGRPACAAVAQSTNQDTVTFSMGCIGARTYVELPDDRAVVVLPGDALDRLVDRLATVTHANSALADFHRGRKAQFEPSATQTSIGGSA
jgi:uncharacterized protein (DUF169 family)